jgi:hypothetical protein
VSFAAITLCVASQRVFIVVISLSTQAGNFWIHPRMYAHRSSQSVSNFHFIDGHQFGSSSVYMQNPLLSRLSKNVIIKIYKPINFTCSFYRHETWSLTLREEGTVC